MDKSKVEYRREYETLIEAMDQGFFALQADGTLVDVNPSGLEILGIDREQFLRRKNISPAWKIINENGKALLPDQFPSVIALNTGLPVKNTVVGVYNPRKESFVWLVINAIPVFREEEITPYQVFITFQDITERKVMEENYRRLATLTSDYVHCCTRSDTTPFRVQWVDGAINSISGYSVQDLLSLGCFLPLVHLDDRQRVSDYLYGLVPGDNKSIEFRIVTKQQQIRWVSEKSQCKVGTSKGELVLLGAVTDITERKRSELSLRESEVRFRNIAEMLPEVVFELDLSGNLKFSNRKAFELFGYSQEDFGRGLNAFDMVIPEERDLARERIRQRLAGETVGAKEYTALRKDGSTFPVILNAAPVMDGLEPVGVLGVMTDITERKSKEMALLTATQDAEAANQAKALFLAKVSHEIRTPLTAIIGFSELMEDAELIPEHKKYLSAISASGSTLASLIDDVLDLSKVEAGKLAINKKEFSLHNLITSLVATQEQQIEEENLTINISINTDVPDLLIGDPLRIRQVLLNLLRNAIKFTEKGGIEIAVSMIEESGLRVLLDIAVKDTGVGIPTDFQEQIFEPFAQVPSSRNSKYSGSGLGLTISRSLAGLMGGSLRVESREGAGSTFHLLVPLQSKSGKRSKKSFPEGELSLWTGPVLKILLAEDNPVNSHYIKTVLENMGHAVSIAENGRVALDVLMAKTFDLVLMDIQMPDMNGTELLSVIREMEQLSGEHLIVIALTAYALIGDKEKYLNMDFDGYLSKPFKTKELIDEMVRLVQYEK